MNSEQKPEFDIREHMYATYTSLRLWMAGLGLLLVLVMLVYYFVGPPRDSISAYYHSDLRNFFVGVLLTSGVFLYLYKGFRPGENLALNIAGFSLIGVALFPTFCDKDKLLYCNADEATIDIANCFCDNSFLGFEFPYAWIVHTVCAVVFIGCIVFVARYRALDTLKLRSDNDPSKLRFKRTYKWIGRIMVIVLVIALICYVFRNIALVSWVFWVEIIEVFLFSLYWLIKLFEIRSADTRQNADHLARTDPEKLAAELEMDKTVVGELERTDTIWQVL